MVKPLPRLRSAASTWSAFVQIKKDIQLQKSVSSLLNKAHSLVSRMQAGFWAQVDPTVLTFPHGTKRTAICGGPRGHVSTKD